MDNNYLNYFPKVNNYKDDINSFKDGRMEQTYIENILGLNRGKMVTVHMVFPISAENNNINFSGIIENSGPDNIILSDPSCGKWLMLPLVYVIYITFEEDINYNLKF